jgi:hypothetical protein
MRVVSNWRHATEIFDRWQGGGQGEVLDDRQRDHQDQDGGAANKASTAMRTRQPPQPGVRRDDAPRWRRDESRRGDLGCTDVAFGHALRQIGPTARDGHAGRVRKSRP